jgi:plasmid stabilization system protein ParE
MHRPIVWSPLAETDFANILAYVSEKWDEKVTNQFIDLTEEIIEQISINPRQFPVVYKNGKIRKCVLTRHNTMFYKATKSQVEILRIHDTRQDPDSLTFK